VLCREVLQPSGRRFSGSIFPLHNEVNCNYFYSISREHIYPPIHSTLIIIPVYPFVFPSAHAFNFSFIHHSAFNSLSLHPSIYRVFVQTSVCPLTVYLSVSRHIRLSTHSATHHSDFRPLSLHLSIYAFSFHPTNYQSSPLYLRNTLCIHTSFHPVHPPIIHLSIRFSPVFLAYTFPIFLSIYLYSFICLFLHTSICSLAYLSIRHSSFSPFPLYFSFYLLLLLSST
jgi:hypothetical protein